MPDKPRDPVPALAAKVERLDRRLAGADGKLGELDQQVKDLAAGIARAEAKKPGATPAPSWLAQDDYAAASEQLRELIGWLDAVYLRYPDAALPTCWAWHPWAIEELLWLAATHAAAYDPKTGSAKAAADWHNTYRPGVQNRISKAIGVCDVSLHAAGGKEARPALTAPLAHAHDATAAAWTNNRETPEPTDFDLEQADQHDHRHHSRTS
jgi:hypothetical protein